MKKALCLTFALAFVSAVAARPALAQEQAHADAKPAGSALKAEILRSLGDAEKKLLALAEATPVEKYAWRPSEKVRSTGEVFMHVAGANYFLPTLFGTKVPDGVNPREFDKSAGDKAKVMDTLKKSFEHARQVIDGASDADLEKATKVFDHEGTVREVMLVMVSHAHEHLGQSIAYARMNGIVPPWSS